MDFRQTLRQSQSLVMTPQLQQAIKLLQLSSMDLQAYVETQVEQNPLLEREEAALDHDDGTSTEFSATELETATGEPLSVDHAVTADSLEFAEASLDQEGFENLFDHDSPYEGGANDVLAAGSRTRGGSFDDPEAGGLEETVAGRETLKEYLTSQIAIDITDPTDRMIAVYLVDLLDDAGYLTDDLSQVAAMLGCPLERIEGVLARLQGLDPPGVFARSLAECLEIQLRERSALTPPMRLLLAHLELIGRRDWSALSRICGVDADSLARLIACLRTLNPKPALTFDQPIAQPLIPDVIVRPKGDGGWSVELNSDALPRVLVNNRYYAQISHAARSKADKQFLNECLQSANWLVKSLHQRATTILKVATEIVRRQQGFLVDGVKALKPLILRDIAEAVSMHESTVSRVTSNKFMATPRGIIEMKYFFTHAVGGGDGDMMLSAEAVRHCIKGLIEAEKPDQILSDDALVVLLRREGIDIARRTIAKYREALGIPSSVQRRRDKSGSAVRW